VVDATSQFNFREISCPVCGSDEYRFVGYRGGEAHQNGVGLKTTIVRCLKCTHQYPNPMPFPSVDLAEIYTDADEYFHNHELDRKKTDSLSLIDEFERRTGRKGRLLDIGCGRGELIWAAKEREWHFEGVDPSSDFIEFGRKHLGVEGKQTSLQDAAFSAGSFDAVAMGGLIEHLYDPAAMLAEISRVLAPNGWLWFDVPNEDGLYMKVGNAYMRFRGKDWVVVMAPTFSPFHVQGFNPRSLKVLLDKNEFVVREFTIFGGMHPQCGVQTVRKQIEFRIAQGVNWLGNRLGQGSYMSVWAQKR
jgi:SAM-dependent methyltransferase